MQTTDEYKAAVSNAVAFKHENPERESYHSCTNPLCQRHYNSIATEPRRNLMFDQREGLHGGSSGQCRPHHSVRPVYATRCRSATIQHIKLNYVVV
jgi:hypothetical protein